VLTSSTRPVETTSSADRFRVAAGPGATASLRVTEEQTHSLQYQLVQTNNDQLRLIFERTEPNSAAVAQVQAALAPVIEARARLAALETQLTDKQHQIDRVTEDQKRLSTSLAALKATPEERALAKRYAGEASADEDQLQSLARDRAALEQQRAAAQQALSSAIDSLDVDMNL
jgi:hypothetical protein